VSRRTFPTTAGGLDELGDCLVAEGGEMAGMESTGVYWEPVVFALQDRIDQVWLLNAEHLRNVLGRKTDVAYPMWIAEFRLSFVPSADIRALPPCAGDAAASRRSARPATTCSSPTGTWCTTK
jgi:hypothetical protein